MRGDAKLLEMLNVLLADELTAISQYNRRRDRGTRPKSQMENPGWPFLGLQ